MAQITSEHAMDRAVQLHRAGQLPQAEKIYREIIASQPNHAGAHNNLAVALREQGKLEDAINFLRQAIALKPDNAASHHNLGMTLTDLGRFDEAIAEHRKAIALDPKFAPAHASLGNALIATGQLDEAIAAYRQAVLIKPDFANAHYYLGKALAEAGNIVDAHREFLAASKLEPRNSSFDSAAISCMHYLPAYDGPTIKAEHARWNRQHAEPLRKFISSHTNARQPDRRLRIGYVSPDFRNHPVGRFMLPLLENHDRHAFEIVCYSDVLASDEITTRSQSKVDHWRDCSKLNHEQLAKQIREDAIDILVDLCGHTSGSRLLAFARKPAPVQISYLGYPATTGLTAMDYRLTDPIADPAGLTEQLNAEALFRLPQTSWCFAGFEVAEETVRVNDRLTFGSFNNLAKITPEMIQLWAKILSELPDSQLLLKATAFASANCKEKILQSFIAQGVESDRITLLSPQPDYSSHLAAYKQIDIALDTFPYHGTTTTCEALWMGVPVITLAGQTHVSRVGVSLLTNVGLPGLVATTPQEYVQLAVKLGTDTDRLAGLHLTLREKMRASPLMDAATFTRAVESAYRQMWQRWCSKTGDL